MIKKFGDYDKIKGYGDSEQLPRGGYVCKIIGAKPTDNTGSCLKIAYDIAEGEYKDFFQAKYDANTSEDKKWPGTTLLYVPSDDGSEKDGWTKRSFRTFTDALEDSNDGYRFDWDETKFKGKLIGFIMNYREWVNSDNEVRMSPNVAKTVAVDKIRSGKFKIPNDKLLPANKRPATAPSPAASDTSFIDVPAGADDEVPF